MKKQFSFTLLPKVCVICSVFTLSFWGALGLAGSEPGVARAVSVNGIVRVEGRSLNPGDVIPPGAVIKTGEGAGIKILLADQSILDLGPDTQFRVESFVKTPEGERQVKLKLETGSIRALVTKKLNSKSSFTIRTKSSVLAVRGTEFSVNTDGKGEKITVSDGNVLRSSLTDNAKPVALNAGNQFVATFKSDAARGVASEAATLTETKVATLSREEIRNELGSNTVEDKTFIKSVDISKGSEGMGNGTGGNSTLTSVAIASGAEERPKGPKERDDGRGDKALEGPENKKDNKGEKGEGKGPSSKNFPAANGGGVIPGGTGGPIGSVPVTPPITPNDTSISAKIIMTVN